MPVKIPDSLPAIEVLQKENIFVMPQDRAASQDIRPLKIGIINLMPTKITTETQLLRLLGNTPLQVEVSLIQTASYRSTHTSSDHLETFYHTFDEVVARDIRFDGLIITGAPVEKLDFDEVIYWDELAKIMDWAEKHVFSTLYICWAAQAGLYKHYGIMKHRREKKCTGIFSHHLLCKTDPLVRGFDDIFLAPHSRYTEVYGTDIGKIPNLHILAESEEAGVYLVVSKDRRQVFLTGHCEYDRETLQKEYLRDKDTMEDPPLPCHYFPNDDDTKEPPMTWKSHAHLLFANWLNYYVYQETPFDLQKI